MTPKNGVKGKKMAPRIGVKGKKMTPRMQKNDTAAVVRLCHHVIL